VAALARGQTRVLERQGQMSGQHQQRSPLVRTDVAGPLDGQRAGGRPTRPDRRDEAPSRSRHAARVGDEQREAGVEYACDGGAGHHRDPARHRHAGSVMDGEPDLGVEPGCQAGAQPGERHRQRHLTLERALHGHQRLETAALSPHPDGQRRAQPATAEQHREGHQAFQHRLART
jgi:hypothetical protein